ncbi:hypothetical protein GQ600_809 [Phytophthora cactorum]|nr:hypothetical protein GQ600_809 [Phytophthora cactorum]
MVLLLSAAKDRYALATLEPLLNQLSNMSSGTFYEQLARWDGLLARVGREPVCRREQVAQSDFDYNFVVPLELARTIERALLQEKRHDKRYESLVQPISEPRETHTAEIIVSYAVFRLTSFYSISRMGSSREKDMESLRLSWSPKQDVDVELLGMETDVTIERNGGRDKDCADDILEKYNAASLQTAFVLASEKFLLDFSKVIGAVARDCFLTDSVLQICFQAVCDMRHGCRVFDSSATLHGWPSSQTILGRRMLTGEKIVEDLSRMKYLVYPCILAVYIGP